MRCFLIVQVGSDLNTDKLKYGSVVKPFLEEIRNSSSLAMKVEINCPSKDGTTFTHIRAPIGKLDPLNI